MMRSPPEPTLARGRVRRFAAAALAVSCCLLSALGFAQPSAAQPPAGSWRTLVTIKTRPPDAQVTLRGPGELSGAAPVELESGWTGRFTVKLEAPGYAVTRGTLFIPEDGGPPRATSEPPGMSGRLLLHSLYFPGVPHLLTQRPGRGILFLTAGAGGLGAVIRDQIEYKDNLDKPDVDSQDRAEDFRYAREKWMIYTGVVWGMSAMDHIVRGRLHVLESSPTQVTLRAPKASRGGVILRSILVPGAGQDYANRKTRGLVWLGASLATGTAYFVAVERHNRILTKLSRAEALLLAASPGEVPARQADVDHFTGLYETSRDLVNGLAFGTASVYVANVLDAAFVRVGGSRVSKKVSITAPVSPRRAEIALTYRF